MTLKEILQEKEDRLQSVPDEFASKVEIAQKQILKQLIDDLDSLDRQNGKITVSLKNLGKIQGIADKLSRYIFDSTDYSNALKVFLNEFNSQSKLSQNYIQSIQGSFEDKSIYQANLNLSQKLTAELLAKSGVNDIFINPMKSILQSSITSGTTFSDAVSALTDLVIGNKDKEGALLSHVKQVAGDAFAFSDAQYLKLVTQDLGYEFYQYFGGLIADSRCFCVQRANKIFHEKEIEYWGETPSLWDKKGSCKHGGGRVPETDKYTIWVYRGGYGPCLHQFVPVPISSVPKDVINRAIQQGFYVPA